MTVYYWETGPRTRFDAAVKPIARDSAVQDLYLSAYGEGIVLAGVFTLEQLQTIVKALRTYEQEIAEAKAYVAAQREA